MDPTGQSPSTSWRTFRFLRRIGKGGFGEVYLAEMSTGGGFAKPVAVKVLREDYLEDEEILKRLRDEARLLGQLSHPNIVQADDLVTLAGRLSVVMEYVPGANLNWVINPRVYPETIPPTVCCQIISCVAEALEAAWSRPSTLTGEPLRVLHRDIKPSNIRLTPDGVIKVLDFGVARADLNDREADTQDLRMGSVPYMAPEVLLDLPHSPATDVYALGVTFYELVARRRFGKCKLQLALHEALIDERFVQANLSEFSLAAEELEDLLRQMLAFDAHMRPSVQEVIARCRDLERRTIGPRVNEWAPAVVPLVVQGVNIEQTEGVFIGQTLSEDSSTVGRSGRQGSGILAGSTLTEGGDLATEETEDTETSPSPPGAVGADSLVPPPDQTYKVVEGPPRRRFGRIAEVLLLLVVVGVGGALWRAGQPVEQVIVELPDPHTEVTVEPLEPPPAKPPRLAEPATKREPVRRSAPKSRATGSRPEKETAPTTREPSVDPPPSKSESAAEPSKAAGLRPEPIRPAPAATTRESASESRPTAPVKSAATQEIAFSSKPLGVAVTIDGVYRGTTPIRVSLTEGAHKVAFEGPDGTRYKTLQVVAGERQVMIYDTAKDVIR